MTSVGRARVALMLVSASSGSDEEDSEGAVEELVVVVVMVGIVAGLASGETGVESGGEAVMVVAGVEIFFVSCLCVCLDWVERLLGWQVGSPVPFVAGQ